MGAESRHQCDFAVIVAMPVVNMMQVAVNQVVGVISMRHLGMAASWTMHVVFWVAAAIMRRRASVWVVLVYADHMFLDVPGMGVMQMPVVQVISMAFVQDGNVSAPDLMHMVVVLMYPVLGLHS